MAETAAATVMGTRLLHAARHEIDAPWDFDPSRPVPTGDLPADLVAAFVQKNWDAAGAKLKYVMDGVITDGPYGRQLVQLVRTLPLGVNPLFDRYRAITAIDYGDWQDLQRCLRASPLEAVELEGIRDIWLAPIDRCEKVSNPAPHRAAMFGMHEYQLSREWRRFRKLVRTMLSNRFAEVTLHRPDMPTNRHLLYRRLQDAVFFSIAEANGGRLDVALSLAREGKHLGNETEQLRIAASDLEELIEWAMGRQGELGRPLWPRQLASPIGFTPLGAWEVLGAMMPLVAVAGGSWFEWSALVTERIATRMGSPRAELQAQSWRVAVQLLGGIKSSETELAALLVKARLSAPGLRVLPQLLDGFARPRHSAFADALESARRVGTVWAQLTALCWMTAINPTPWTTRALHRLLNVTGWRRLVLVPPEIAAEAALGLSGARRRGPAVVELASVSGRPNVVLEVASASLNDGDPATQGAGIRALARLGTSRARDLLASVAKERTTVGELARAAISKPAGGPLLSERETEVLQLAARGLTNKEIGGQLGLSEHTIARHIANARSKLGAANRAEAVSRLAELSRT